MDRYMLVKQKIAAQFKNAFDEFPVNACRFNINSEMLSIIDNNVPSGLSKQEQEDFELSSIDYLEDEKLIEFK